jgi:hypothetical protein
MAGNDQAWQGTTYLAEGWTVVDDGGWNEARLRLGENEVEWGEIANHGFAGERIAKHAVPSLL